MNVEDIMMMQESFKVKRQFFSMSRICDEKCSKPKIFYLAFGPRSSQNYFVLALFCSLYN